MVSLRTLWQILLPSTMYLTFCGAMLASILAFCSRYQPLCMDKTMSGNVLRSNNNSRKIVPPFERIILSSPSSSGRICTVPVYAAPCATDCTIMLSCSAFPCESTIIRIILLASARHQQDNKCVARVRAHACYFVVLDCCGRGHDPHYLQLRLAATTAAIMLKPSLMVMGSDENIQMRLCCAFYATLIQTPHPPHRETLFLTGKYREFHTLMMSFLRVDPAFFASGPSALAFTSAFSSTT